MSLRCEEREGGFTLIAVAENPATPISVLKRLAETQKENVLRRTLPDDPYIHFYVSVSRIAEIQLEKRTNNN